MHARARTRTHTRAHTRTHTRTRRRTHSRTHASARTHGRTNANIHTYTHIHTSHTHTLSVAMLAQEGPRSPTFHEPKLARLSRFDLDHLRLPPAIVQLYGPECRVALLSVPGATYVLGGMAPHVCPIVGAAGDSADGTWRGCWTEAADLLGSILRVPWSARQWSEIRSECSGSNMNCRSCGGSNLNRSRRGGYRGGCSSSDMNWRSCGVCCCCFATSSPVGNGGGDGRQPQGQQQWQPASVGLAPSQGPGRGRGRGSSETFVLLGTSLDFLR